MSPQLALASLFSVLALGLLCLQAERLAPPALPGDVIALQAEPGARPARVLIVS